MEIVVIDYHDWDRLEWRRRFTTLTLGSTKRVLCRLCLLFGDCDLPLQAVVASFEFLRFGSFVHHPLLQWLAFSHHIGEFNWLGQIPDEPGVAATEISVAATEISVAATEISVLAAKPLVLLAKNSLRSDAIDGVPLLVDHLPLRRPSPRDCVVRRGLPKTFEPQKNVVVDAGERHVWLHCSGKFVP